jgi:hypothetical protein
MGIDLIRSPTAIGSIINDPMIVTESVSDQSTSVALWHCGTVALWQAKSLFCLVGRSTGLMSPHPHFLWMSCHQQKSLWEKRGSVQLLNNKPWHSLKKK